MLNIYTNKVQNIIFNYIKKIFLIRKFTLKFIYIYMYIKSFFFLILNLYNLIFLLIYYM